MKEEIHQEEKIKVLVISNVSTVIEEATMLEIAGLRKDQGHQEEAEIVMIVIEGDIGMKIEIIDLHEKIEMIIEEETEEVQMQIEAEEETEVIQEIEGEIIIK